MGEGLSRSAPVSRDGPRHALAICIVTTLGILVRAFSVVPSDFALNDGGLFYQMVLDLRETWPLLPATTTYNGLDIPFAYPPLGFYLGATMHDMLGGIEIMRILPLILACLTVPAVYLLASAIHGGVLLPTASALVFALTPRSFEWLVMGGGLTRALGLLLAIISLWLTWRMLKQPTVFGSLLAGVAGGLTALAHPQTALFTASAGFIFVVARMRGRARTESVIRALFVAGVVVLPWFLAVLLRHGIEPLISATGSQPGLLVGAFNLLTLDFSGSRVSVIVGALTISGIIVSVMHAKWLLPVWFATVMLLDSRGGAIYATVPAAMLAGGAIVRLIIAPFWREPPKERLPSTFARGHPAAAFLAVFIFLAAMTDALGSQVTPGWPGTSLSRDHRDAMSWIATNEAPAADYLVISGRFWAIDATAEWFPTLTGAHSAATVQGTEWLGKDQFYDSAEASEELRNCVTAAATCVEVWATRWNVVYSHIYLPKGAVTGPGGSLDCCAALRESLAASENFHETYDGAGATIFERNDSER